MEIKKDSIKIVMKPLWGKEEIIVNNDHYCGKKLHIEHGKRFSLQYHKKKHETFYVEKGRIILERGLDGNAENEGDIISMILMKEGDTMQLPPFTKHRCGSLNGTSIIVESSTHHEDSDTYKINVDNRIPEEIMRRYSGEVVVVASGYFDPLHVGHIEYLNLAKKLGDKLIVIINNDTQTKIKKGYVFMSEEERARIVKSLAHVDEVVISIDDDHTVCKTLTVVKPVIFAKGGDRYSYEIPEKKICDSLGIKIIDGLGEKIQSSSKLVENSITNKKFVQNN